MTNNKNSNHSTKQLLLNFTGKGEVRGFQFTQIFKNDVGYIYEVNSGGSIHYEVFLELVNLRFNCISYPSGEAFGVWAWTCNSYDKAFAKLTLLSNRNINSQPYEVDN